MTSPPASQRMRVQNPESIGVESQLGLAFTRQAVVYLVVFTLQSETEISNYIYSKIKL
jgi:hypothetical protein